MALDRTCVSTSGYLALSADTTSSCKFTGNSKSGFMTVCNYGTTRMSAVFDVGPTSTGDETAVTPDATNQYAVPPLTCVVVPVPLITGQTVVNVESSAAGGWSAHLM